MLPAVLTASADAFLQVGAWVGAMLAGLAVLRRRGGGLPLRWLARPGAGPLVGAALGVTPGCGGAVVVMPLHANGQVSFGTAVATLVATMGDSSFVLLAAEPLLGFGVHGGLFALGVGSGVLVDALGVRRPRTRAAETVDPGRGAMAVPVGSAQPSTVGAAAVRADLWGRPRVTAVDPWVVGFFALVGVGLVVAVADLIGALPAAGGDAVGPVTALGLAGTSVAVTVAIANRARPRPDLSACAAPSTALVDAARETAAIIAWVAAVFVGYEVLVQATGLDLSGLAGAGLLPVLLAAVLGLVPGCGPQIIVTSLYVDGVVGLPVLLANAVSQDGDALLPLIARDRRAALAATVTTTVPALLVGAAAWLLLS